MGLVSKIFETREKMEEGLLETAKVIASKSPMGIHTLKVINRRELYKKAYEGLDYVLRVNSSALLTKDTVTAMGAFLRKEKPVFPKL